MLSRARRWLCVLKPVTSVQQDAKVYTVKEYSVLSEFKSCPLRADMLLLLTADCSWFSVISCVSLCEKPQCSQKYQQIHLKASKSLLF